MPFIAVLTGQAMERDSLLSELNQDAYYKEMNSTAAQYPLIFQLRDPEVVGWPRFSKSQTAGWPPTAQATCGPPGRQARRMLRPAACTGISRASARTRNHGEAITL